MSSDEERDIENRTEEGEGAQEERTPLGRFTELVQGAIGRQVRQGPTQQETNLPQRNLFEDLEE